VPKPVILLEGIENGGNYINTEHSDIVNKLLTFHTFTILLESMGNRRRLNICRLIFCARDWSTLNVHCTRRKTTLYFSPAIATKEECLVTQCTWCVSLNIQKAHTTFIELLVSVSGLCVCVAVRGRHLTVNRLRRRHIHSTW